MDKLFMEAPVILPVWQLEKECVYSAFSLAAPFCVTGVLAYVWKRCLNFFWRPILGKEGEDGLTPDLKEMEAYFQGVDSDRMEQMKQFVTALLAQLGPAEQKVFICRYWYLETTGEISQRLGYSQRKTASMLRRIRKKLDRTLAKGCLKA